MDLSISKRGPSNSSPEEVVEMHVGIKLATISSFTNCIIKHPGKCWQLLLGCYHFISNDCLANHCEYFNLRFFSTQEDAHYPAGGKGLQDFSFHMYLHIFSYLSVDLVFPGWMSSPDLLPKEFYIKMERQKDIDGQDSHLAWSRTLQCDGIVSFGNLSSDTNLLRKTWSPAHLEI